jgi:hypothetical protein
MKRLFATLLVAMLAAPASQARDVPSLLERAQRRADARDTLLAALGEATLECLGSVSPRDYHVNAARVLERAFTECTTRDPSALERIDQLLGVQHSREAQVDRLSERFAQVWTAGTRAFPSRVIKQCPTWELMHVIDAPTEERIAHFASKTGADGIGKEYRWYKVTSPQCGSNGLCAVWHAAKCGAPFGDQMIVWLDPASSSVIVDPVWWLTDYEDESGGPFNKNGAYRHWSSYYGEIPGARYAHVNREGESCTKYSEITQKHYTDRKWVLIDCGGGWMCATYCN